jgi:hypothetical protein
MALVKEIATTLSTMSATYTTIGQALFDLFSGSTSPPFIRMAGRSRPTIRSRNRRG